MSANNYLRISKYYNPKKFVVSISDADTGQGAYISQHDTAEQALNMCHDYMLDNDVEYGVRYQT